MEPSRDDPEIHGIRLTTDEHLKLSQLLIGQRIESGSHDDVIDALYRSGEVLQRKDFESLVRSTYYQLDDGAVFLKKTLQEILQDDNLFHDIQNYKNHQAVLDSDVDLSGRLFFSLGRCSAICASQRLSVTLATKAFFCRKSI